MNESSSALVSNADHDTASQGDKPCALILQTAGTNCDRELAFAFQLAGATTRTVHVNELIRNPGQIENYQLIGFPGGFSYGDDIAAGRIFASTLRHRLLQPLIKAHQRGVPMIGICNGFQVLVKLGLLPDPPEAAPAPEAAPEAASEEATAGSASVVLDDAQPSYQSATLADNTAGRFIDRWLTVEADASSKCIWTKNIARENDGQFDLPIAHGEGRFVPASDELLAQWQQRGQIALRYAADQNINGSADRIAGVCDPTGLILGLMPHPERFILPTQHPQWSRAKAAGHPITPLGLSFFKNAVAYVKAHAEARA